MKTCVTRDEIRDELLNECAIIGRSYVVKDEHDHDAMPRLQKACDRARCLLDLLVTHCNEMEPEAEGFALQEINKVLFSCHGNLNTGECKYRVQSWDTLEALKLLKKEK